MRDAVFLLGFGLVWAGLWLVSLPLALAVAGSLMMVLAVFGALRGGIRDDS